MVLTNDSNEPLSAPKEEAIEEVRTEEIADDSSQDDVSNAKKEINIERKSFAEKLSNADEQLLAYYRELQEELAAYGLKSRISSSGDTYRLHRKTYVKIAIGGKSLKVFFALNAKDYADSTIPIGHPRPRRLPPYGSSPISL